MTTKHPDTWWINSRLTPKTWIARSVHNFWEEHSPTIRADVAAATLAMEDADMSIWYASFACIAFPFQCSIGCRLGVDADKAVPPCTVNVECHEFNAKRWLFYLLSTVTPEYRDTKIGQ
jgi:hypothetical protein